MTWMPMLLMCNSNTAAKVPTASPARVPANSLAHNGTNTRNSPKNNTTTSIIARRTGTAAASDSASDNRWMPGWRMSAGFLPARNAVANPRWLSESPVP